MDKQQSMKMVIALGGNALEETDKSGTAEQQLKVVGKTCSHIVKLIEAGWQIAIVHGNGPQVGRIAQAFEEANVPSMPFDACDAMSQGYIGYHIQQSLNNALRRKNINIPVVTFVTQIVVDENDAAFCHPAKPIGSFYTDILAERLVKERGYVMKEDSGRGWRRMIASPVPHRIIEAETVKKLWPTAVVVTAGGGGIPVAEAPDGSISGVEAVIDKDLAAELLAEELDADVLLILTEVEKAALNFNAPKQKDLSLLSPADAKKYISEGHFAQGSMLPKIQAAVKFVEGRPGKIAIITSLYKAEEALKGEAGTRIENI